MGRFMQMIGREDPEAYHPIQADAELFDEIREELPHEPMIQLQPRKDNPGLEAGTALCKALYHYRKDKMGRNDSPVNSFELWFDEGEVRFYFHPDTREQKNSGMKHFEDKFPGTRMTEEEDPFPQINKGDYISGARMSLTHHFARPLRMTEGPNAFKRDPFGDLISDMVVEGERTTAGERVRSEDVRMVVQVIFQPADRGMSRGGLWGTDFNDYADKLKQPEQKTGMDQTARMLFGLDPQERAPTAKEKKTAKMISELRGEPEFFFRLRILCISPYAEMAKQHTERVCEVFETYYNPVTEQGFQTLPQEESTLRDMLTKAASRDLCYSSFDKMFSGKDVLSIPELAGLVHLPNGNIEAPEINWTNMAKGAGVPTNTPDLDEVDSQLQAELEREEQEAQGEQGGSGSRMQDFSLEQVEEMQDDGEDLSIDVEDDPNEVIEETVNIEGDPQDETMAVDEVLYGDDDHSEESEFDSGDDHAADPIGEEEPTVVDEEDVWDDESDSSGGFLSKLGFGKSGGENNKDESDTDPDKDTDQERQQPTTDTRGTDQPSQPQHSQQSEPENNTQTDSSRSAATAENTTGTSSETVDEGLDHIVRDWEEELQEQNQQAMQSSGDRAQEDTAPPEASSGATDAQEEADRKRTSPEEADSDQDDGSEELQTQDDLPDAVLEKLED